MPKFAKLARIGRISRITAAIAKVAFTHEIATMSKIVAIAGCWYGLKLLKLLQNAMLSNATANQF